MKIKLHTLLVCLSLLILTVCNSQGQTKKLIHYWHFNNTVPLVHLGSVPADYSTFGNAYLVYKPIPGGGSDTAQSNLDNLTGDTINQRAGFGGCCGATNYAVRTRNPSDYMQFLWYLPTSKYQNVVVTYETQSSSTSSGQHRQLFSYSIDSGASFTTTGLPLLYDSAGLAWGKVKLDLGSISQVNNNGRFVFRMTFSPPNTGTGGNNRFDNITVEGDTMTAPSFASTPLTSAIIGRPFSYTVVTTGSPAPLLSVSGNPTWLTLTNNVLSGTPTAIDTVGPVKLTATNTLGSSSQVFTIVVGDSIVPVPPAILSNAPVTVMVDSLYSYTISATGVPKPLLSISGNPAWMTLKDSILSGTPTTPGIFGPIKITAANISGSTDQTFNLTVQSHPLITSAAPTTIEVLTGYSYAVNVTGTPAPSLSVTGNPAWLQLNGNILSGIPNQTGLFGPVTLTATNEAGSNQQTFTIRVVPAKKLIHYWHFNNTITGVHLVSVPADYTSEGNASLIYRPIPGGGSDTAQAYLDNLAGDTINQQQGYGGCCGTTNYAVRTRNPSDNMQFLWYIPASRFENIQIRYETQSSSTASGQHRQLFAYSLDSGATFTTAGLPITFDSAGLNWEKVVLDLSSIENVNNNSRLVFRITFTAPNTSTSGNNRFDNISIRGDSLIIPAFINNPISTAIIGRPYSYTIRTTGAPVPTLAISGLPAWLSLNDSIISGIPPAVDTVGPIIITATNVYGNAQQKFNLVVADSVLPVQPSVTSMAPTGGKVNFLFTYAIKTSGVPKPVLSVSGNPSWLVLQDTVLSGIPPTNGIFGPIHLTATNIAGSAEQSFTLTVPAAPKITSTAPITAIANIAYTYTITASGTPAPVISVSGNPWWLALDGNVLTGLTSSVGTFGPITVTATNSEGSIRQTFSIEVQSFPIITSLPQTDGIAGHPYNYSATALGSPTPTYTVSGNPSWLTVNGNTLSGTPTSSGFIGPVTLTATNSVSADQQTFYLHIANPAVNTSTYSLIHYWNFNSSLPQDGSGGTYFGPNPIAPDYSVAPNAALIYLPLPGTLSDTGQIDNLAGDTINQREGFGGCCGSINNAVRARNPSDSMQFLWFMPTTGYKNIVIKYETQLSSVKSGQQQQIFSYSLDSGLTYITAGLPVISNYADTAWSAVTLDLRALSQVNANAKFVLKLTFSAPNTGDKGNNRFDNITVEGESIMVNAGKQYGDGGYSLYPNPAGDAITLSGPENGEQQVVVCNMVGVVVLTREINESKNTFDTRSLTPGMYFMTITQKTGGAHVTMIFIKH